MTSLAGKTAIVTGVSRGIGRAIATTLAREGLLLGPFGHTRPNHQSQASRIGLV